MANPADSRAGRRWRGLVLRTWGGFEADWIDDLAGEVAEEKPEAS
jgi:hypothetical protein